MPGNKDEPEPDVIAVAEAVADGAPSPILDGIW